MSDADLRALEREARTSGDEAAAQRFRAACHRAGHVLGGWESRGASWLSSTAPAITLRAPEGHELQERACTRCQGSTGEVRAVPLDGWVVRHSPFEFEYQQRRAEQEAAARGRSVQDVVMQALRNRDAEIRAGVACPGCGGGPTIHRRPCPVVDAVRAGEFVAVGPDGTLRPAGPGDVPVGIATGSGIMRSGIFETSAPESGEYARRPPTPPRRGP